MDVAGKHHMRGAHPTGRRNNALANAGRIERNRGRVLENARTRFLRERCKPECIVVWINVETLPIVDGAEISPTMKLFTHSLGRPEFDVGANPTHALDLAPLFDTVVSFRHVQPTVDEVDPGH